MALTLAQMSKIACMICVWLPYGWRHALRC